jgi:hypothetical protein
VTPEDRFDPRINLAFALVGCGGLLVSVLGAAIGSDTLIRIGAGMVLGLFPVGYAIVLADDWKRRRR